MAELPPGPVPDPEMQALIKKIVNESPLERLKRQAPVFTPNNTYGRCSIDPPPGRQTYLSQGPTREQEAAQREAARKQANTIGIYALGPIAGGPPALVRLLGGNEDAVESAAELGMNITDIAGGAKGAKGRRAGTRRPDPGTHVAKPKPKVLKKGMTREEIKEWMLKNGVDPNKVDSYIDGIDMSKPVDLVELPQGTELSRYGNPQSFPGAFASPAGGLGDNVGISLNGRVPGTVTLDSPISALQSTAADFGGNAGGGTQYQFGNGWQNIPWKF